MDCCDETEIHDVNDCLTLFYLFLFYRACSTALTQAAAFFLAFFCVSCVKPWQGRCVGEWVLNTAYSAQRDLLLRYQSLSLYVLVAQLCRASSVASRLFIVGSVGDRFRRSVQSLAAACVICGRTPTDRSAWLVRPSDGTANAKPVSH